MSGRPAAFLDRDGTLNVEIDYLADPDRFVLIDGAAEAVRLLRDSGFDVVVVTNQSGIARGMLDEETLGRIHARMDELLAAEGTRVDAVRFCPHHPELGEPPYRRACPCRKPLPGMIADAAEELGSDLARSWVVGDSLRDLQAGAALGVPGILVGTGKGADQRSRLGEVESPKPRFAPDLLAAAHTILDSAPGA